MLSQHVSEFFEGISDVVGVFALCPFEGIGESLHLAHPNQCAELFGPLGSKDLTEVGYQLRVHLYLGLEGFPQILGGVGDGRGALWVSDNGVGDVCCC